MLLIFKGVYSHLLSDPFQRHAILKTPGAAQGKEGREQASGKPLHLRGRHAGRRRPTLLTPAPALTHRCRGYLPGGPPPQEARAHVTDM